MRIHPVLDDPSYFHEKPVDATTAQLLLSFLNGLFIKMESEGYRFLIAEITKLRWLKTGSDLKTTTKTFLNTDLSDIPTNIPIIAIWCSSWEYYDCNYYSKESEKGNRNDDFFLMETTTLAEDCRSDNPQHCYLDFEDIDYKEGNFSEINLPKKGYQLYTEDFLSDLIYSDYESIDMEYSKEAHPIIRKYIDSQLSSHYKK